MIKLKRRQVAVDRGIGYIKFGESTLQTERYKFRYAGQKSSVIN
jgi:hypothetical protein